MFNLGRAQRAPCLYFYFRRTDMGRSKWTYEIIVLLVGAILAGSGWYWSATKDDRIAEAELQVMIKYAQRQALEIAIIEQASKLTDYRKQLEAMQIPAKSATNSFAPVNPIPIEPVADPKDVNVD